MSHSHHTEAVNEDIATKESPLFFDVKQSDWINPYTGEMLTGFIPTNELINLLQNHIDKVRE